MLGSLEGERAVLNRILTYTKDIARLSGFYSEIFHFEAVPDANGRIVELQPLRGGCIIMLHQAAKSQRIGQATVKLIFDVEDIAAFKTRAAARGLKFGAIHQADGYEFANAKDPDGNAVSISSCGFRK
jgi:predicted enzyme related to lactoylglutathione lyase